MDEDFFKELLNISLRMAQTRTLEPLLAYAMRVALKLVGAEYGYLVLHDPNGSFDFRVSLDEHGQIIENPETQVSQTILNKVIATQKPLVLSNALDDAAFGQAQSVAGLRLRSVMCVPLITYRLTLGAIYVENRAEAEIFKNEDVEPLTFFATQAAVFIENAILNENLEEQVKTRTVELQESQANLRALVENTQDDIWSVARDYQVITVNSNFRRNVERYGFKLAPGLGLSVAAAEEAILQKWQSRYAQVFAGQYISAEDVYEQDDENRYYDVSLSPIISEDGQVTGATAFSREITERKRAEEALKALNRRMQAELTLARKIQQGLLPPAQPKWPHLDVICYSVPAHEVGGDLYAYHAFNLPIGASSLLNLDPVGSYGLAVGDVSGKGLPAALLMGTSLAVFESAMRQEFGPDELLAYLDGALAPYTKTTHQNCALVYVEITTPGQNTKGTMRIVNAGCISPYIKRHTGEVEATEVGGFALGQGLASTRGFQEVTLSLSKGDIIVLTSDGLVEANNAAGEMFGFERLKAAIAGGPLTGAKAMLDHLKAEVATFVGEAELHDDLTIVVAQV
jgi:sigma-B regulation protein RsbU (phosphoserine phosphatase)